MTTNFRRAWATSVIGFATLWAGCGSSQPGGSDSGANCTAVDAGTIDPGQAQAGLSIIQMYQCQQCHGSDLSGNNDGLEAPGGSVIQYPPNLTPDPATGLGCWTDAQISNAILNSFDNQGNALCPPMPHFSSLGLQQSDVDQIIAYLRSLPVVSNQVSQGPDCPCTADSDCQGQQVCANDYCTCESLVCSFGADGGMSPPDAGPADAGPSGAVDGGVPDAGSFDAGSADAGLGDAGVSDAGPADAGGVDAGPADAGEVDAGAPDAGASDAGSSDVDAGTTDAGTTDAGTTDAGTTVTDAGTAADDAGDVDAGS